MVTAKSPPPSTSDKDASSSSIPPAHTEVEMRDPSAPHNDPTNPFAFEPKQLSALMDPKNINLLHEFGGLDGLARGLHVDLKTGISSSQTIRTPITLSDVQGKPEANADNSHAPAVDPALFSDRSAVFGTNVLPAIKSKSIFQLMWMAFKDKMLILLTIAAFVSLAVGLYEDIANPEHDAQGHEIPGVKWVEGVAIIVAVVVVVLVGSINDYRKEKQFRKLNARKEDREVKATRDGDTQMISVHDIQVGDILYLEPGDIVAADGVFIEGHNLRADESAATGESDAVRKRDWEACYQQSQPNDDSHTETVVEKTEAAAKSDVLSVPGVDDAQASSIHTKVSYAPRSSAADPFIISGSKILEGVCTYIVTGVGIDSYYGRTMMALRAETQDTPLQKKLNDLADMIAKLGMAAGILMLLAVLIRYFVGWRYGVPSGAANIVRDILNILIVVVTIIVVAVPEGLPLAVTVSLAYATQRMLKDNNLVRVLAACETMGNATTICSDKTGTLTQNDMAVVAGTFGASLRFVKELPKDRTDVIAMTDVESNTPKPLLTLLNQAVAVNSTAFKKAGETQFVGNKTETALLSFARDSMQSKDAAELRNTWPVQQRFPFSSERKAMATVIRVPNPADPTRSIYRAHVKGASEILLQYCSSIVSLRPESYRSNQDEEATAVSRNMTDDDVKRLKRIIESYAKRSLRTIGIAYRDFDQWPPTVKSSKGEAELSFDDLVGANALTLMSIVGIEDPLRPGVKEAVEKCQQAGVFVRMVTGDNVTTAKSIAKQCGIYQGGIVMEGPVFRALPNEELNAILPRLQVLARSSPEDKRILVQRLQELGDIVAVTGDGTNDGPALKRADVGFSMGIAGTEVAKEASSIILMDDNFASIVKAIMWGRCVNDSVKKFLQFQLTVNITAVVLTFISAVASAQQKSVLTAVQLLWVNLIMDTFAALALATDPPTEELLQRPPEPRSAPLITFKMWKMIFGQAIFQITVTLVLLYSDILHYSPESAILQTIVFNTFVFCQIFNEINCRRVDSKLNVFHNVLANRYFIFIVLLCVLLQCLIVNFGGTAFQVTRVGGVEWAIAIVVGLLALPIGVVIRLIPDEIFGFLFRNPVTRQRYMGGDNSVLPPSIYVIGTDRIAWNEDQPDIHTRKDLDPHASYVIAAGMVASAPSKVWSPATHTNDNDL